MKHIYLIAYEIQDGLYDYSVLKDAIRSISDDYQHPLESLWFLKTDEPMDINEMSEQLRKCLQSSTDKLYILEMPSEPNHSGWMPKVMWKWFKK